VQFCGGKYFERAPLFRSEKVTWPRPQGPHRITSEEIHSIGTWMISLLQIVEGLTMILRSLGKCPPKGAGRQGAGLLGNLADGTERDLQSVKSRRQLKCRASEAETTDQHNCDFAMRSLIRSLWQACRTRQPCPSWLPWLFGLSSFPQSNASPWNESANDLDL
jgi:hypothetical protein